jgi:hypothetical protein
MTNTDEKYAVCNHCTYKLVAIAYKRAPWFRLFREPLKLGMKYLAFIHHIDAKEYQVRTPACYQCIRFYKTALFKKSASFRWLHDRFNPIFNKMIARIVTDDERKQAKIYADAASAGSVSSEESEDWMKDLGSTL